MKSILSLLILLSTSLALMAQSNLFEFERNNFRWHQRSNGSIFYNSEDQLPGLLVPNDENNHTIFASALWLAGLDAADQVKASFKRFCLQGDESCYYNWGPLRLDGTVASDEEVEPYNHVWFVTGEQIDMHRAFFDCAMNPNCDESVEFPSYTIPPDFITWPAQSAEGSNFSEYLAPFFDRNNDGEYNPESGDHPVICGDFSSYTIWNDRGSSSGDQNGFSIGIEVHTRIYGYDALEGAEFNTLFVQHQIHNRGIVSLNDAYAGIWTDFDLGNFSDDFIRTNVENSLIYVYNDGFDEGSPIGPGYGADLPIMGLKILGGPYADSNNLDDSPSYSAFYANETSGFNDGIVDNERLGLATSLYHHDVSGENATRDPHLPIDHYNYMRGYWKDGTPLTIGGMGYNPDSVGAIQAKYVFSGDSDALLAGTNGVDPQYPSPGGWTEENEGRGQGDRRMLASSGPFTFLPGDVQYVDLAYIFARESQVQNETVLETLFSYAGDVEDMACGQIPQVVLTAEEGLPIKPLEVYPNPSHGTVSISAPELTGELSVIDLAGREIFQTQMNPNVNNLDLQHLSNGVYMIQIRTEDALHRGKIIINR